MKRVLITGGQGFIARNLAELLGGEYELTACGSQELNLLEAENVAEIIMSGRFDAVIHTSTYDPAPKYSTKDPAKVLENNLQMFFNVARNNECFGKMIYFGSGAEFDRRHWRPRMTESYFDQHVPNDQYGFSKYIMNKFALQSTNVYNLRIFSVFGKYEDWRYRFISRACCCALLGLPLTIKQDVYYDFMPVADLARIVKWFIEGKPRHQVYNVCSGEAHSFTELAGLVAEVTGRKVEAKIQEPGPGVEYSGDSTRLLREMPDFHFTPLKVAVKSLYDWYAANRQIIKQEELA